MPYIQNLKKVTTLIFSLLLTYSAVSQRVITNSQGQRVIVYPDGSSRMANQRDSALVRQYLQQQGMPVENPSGSVGQKQNKGEEQEFLQKQWKDLYTSILEEEKVIQKNFRDATNAQFKAAEQFENAEANKKLVEPDQYAKLHEAYEASVNDLRLAKRCEEGMGKILEKAQMINASLSKLTSSKFEKTRANFNLFRANCNPGGKVTVLKNSETIPLTSPPISASSLTPQPTTPEYTKPVMTTAAASTATPYDPSMVAKLPTQYDKQAYSPTPFECKIKIDTVDQTSGTRRIELLPSQLFTYTDPDLRPYFKDKDLITAYSRLSKIGPYIYLTVDFHIASSHAQNNFGALQNGSLLRLKLFDGEYITLYDLRTDKGKIDPYSGHTIYTGQYALGKNEIKKISHSSLDKMRVLWATGYEDYDVYHLDVLIDQLHCLLSKK